MQVYYIVSITFCLLNSQYNKKKEAVGQLVWLGYTYHYASTCHLSTWSSSTALSLSSGILILKEASCLDAFSTYPVRT
uniref:Uncharacterized protein n=1 Tax=Daphnia magna TaxID=35525 RepID=A0A0N8EG58_9CRUS